MWDGAVVKGMSRQERDILKAPLVYAEIMSFIKVGGAAALPRDFYHSAAWHGSVWCL
jgi:hypothetical protein